MLNGSVVYYIGTFDRLLSAWLSAYINKTDVSMSFYAFWDSDLTSGAKLLQIWMPKIRNK